MKRLAIVLVMSALAFQVFAQITSIICPSEAMVRQGQISEPRIGTLIPSNLQFLPLVKEWRRMLLIGNQFICEYLVLVPPSNEIDTLKLSSSPFGPPWKEFTFGQISPWRPSLFGIPSCGGLRIFGEASDTPREDCSVTRPGL